VVIVPGLWSMMLLAIAGGAVLGVMFVILSRRRVQARATNALPRILY
jgi:hypothetical protein